MKSCVVTHRMEWWWPTGNVSITLRRVQFVLGRFALTGKQTVPSTLSNRLAVEWILVNVVFVVVPMFYTDPRSASASNDDGETSTFAYKLFMGQFGSAGREKALGASHFLHFVRSSAGKLRSTGVHVSKHLRNIFTN